MVAIAFAASLVGFGALGLFAWLASDVPRAMREVALNTRKSAGPAYVGMETLRLLFRVVAVLAWVLAVVIPTLLAVGAIRLP